MRVPVRSPRRVASRKRAMIRLVHVAIILALLNTACIGVLATCKLSKLALLDKDASYTSTIVINISILILYHSENMTICASDHAMYLFAPFWHSYLHFRRGLWDRRAIIFWYLQL